MGVPPGLRGLAKIPNVRKGGTSNREFCIVRCACSGRQLPFAYPRAYSAMLVPVRHKGPPPSALRAEFGEVGGGEVVPVMCVCEPRLTNPWAGRSEDRRLQRRPGR